MNQWYKILLIVSLCCYSLISTGEAVWNGQLSGISCNSARYSPRVSVDNGTLKLNASFDIPKHEYLVFDMSVRAFIFSGKALSFRFSCNQPLRGDMFYVKALNAAGRVVASFYTRITDERERTYVCTPESNSGGMNWFASDVKAPLTDPVVKLRFFYCRMAGKSELEIRMSNLELVPPAPPVVTVTPQDHGLAVRGGTCRGLHTAEDADGNDCVVIFLMDDINRRMLQIDAATGKTDEIPVPFAPGDGVYSSLKSARGKCYSLFGHHFAEYDPAQKKFTFIRKVKDLAAMSMAEDRNGIIYAATYPDLCLYSYNPATGEFKDFGQLHQETFAQYPRSITVADDGTLYIGTGSTRGQAIHFYPETGRAVALIPKSEEPAGKSLFVRRFTDGKIYARHLDLFFLLDGDTATKLDKVPDARFISSPLTGSQSLIIREFDSGRKLVGIDLGAGKLSTSAADGSDLQEVSFTFKNHGAPMMGIDVTGDGIVGGGGFFPFCFGTFDPATGQKTIQAADVQCNAIKAHGKYFYIAGYAGGLIMRFDPSKPWNLSAPMRRTQPDLESNPVLYGVARSVTIRPHGIAVSPDGKYFVAGGTPEYGQTGGGLAIVDTQSGQMTLVPHTELAPLEAPYALAVLNNGLIICGTTVNSGTGGEIKAAEGSLLMYDISRQKCVWRSKELGKVNTIYQLILLDDHRAMGINSNRELFIVDLDLKKVVVRRDISNLMPAAQNQSCRALLSDGHGGFYFLGHQLLAKIDPADGKVIKTVKISGNVQVGGGIHNDVLYFVSGNNWKSIDLKEVFR
ncbi:MAG: hypothetical protein IKC94_00515 [Lentisphaeria bacterium]|nr:hypothetical protein [Lentisphaeria bacterium]